MRTARMLAAVTAALLLSTTAFAQEEDTGKLELIPNSVKYSDTGVKNATGRSGAASVEARALLSQNGTTTIEVTTGALDSGAAAPGSIDRLQLKLGNDVTNYNNLGNGGTFTLERTGLARHTPLQIQTNVSGIDPTRTDVVTVDTVVARRPDLKVTEVDAPAAVRLDQPFTVTALVAELNGDVGARTDCLLTTTSGTVLDRADGIWVDADDTVQCMFSLSLSALGSHSFQIRLANTKPADWEPWFDNLTFRVLGVTSKQWEAKSTQRRTWRRSVITSSNDPEHPDDDLRDDTVDQFSFSGVVDAPIDFHNFQFSIEEKTDGNLIYRYDPAGGFLPDVNDTGCRLSDRRHAIYTVCRFGNGLAVNVNTFASKAVFVSSFWIQRYDPATGQPSWIRATAGRTITSGPLTRYGSTHDVRIRLTDGVSSWEAAPFMVLQAWEAPEEQQTSCTTLWDGSTRCVETTTRRSGKDGTDSED